MKLSELMTKRLFGGPGPTPEKELKFLGMISERIEEWRRIASLTGMFAFFCIACAAIDGWAYWMDRQWWDVAALVFQLCCAGLNYALLAGALRRLRRWRNALRSATCLVAAARQGVSASAVEHHYMQMMAAVEAATVGPTNPLQSLSPNRL